jgi:hypothetical protein
VTREQPIEAYPLCWPPHRKRSAYRQYGRFKTAFAKARDHIVAEVQRLGGRQTIISTNIELKRDGLPYANFKTPDDPGVAVYFTYKGKQMCFACDRYRNIEDNMHAISLTISALRGIARWGTGDMMESAFSGFTALPSPDQVVRWHDILGVSPMARREEVEAAYRRLRSLNHPDKGGEGEKFDEVQRAWEQYERGQK